MEPHIDAPLPLFPAFSSSADFFRTPGPPSDRRRLINHEGEQLSLAEWARRLGVQPQTITSRLKRMPVERALTMPKQPRRGGRRRETAPRADLAPAFASLYDRLETLQALTRQLAAALQGSYTEIEALQRAVASQGGPA